MQAVELCFNISLQFLTGGRWLTQGDLYSGQKTVMIVEAVVSLTNNKHTKMTLCTAWLKMWIPAKHSSIDSTTVFWSYAEVRLGLPTASKHRQHKDMLRIQKKTWQWYTSINHTIHSFCTLGRTSWHCGAGLLSLDSWTPKMKVLTTKDYSVLTDGKRKIRSRGCQQLT